jgi:Zn-dependent protease
MDPQIQEKLVDLICVTPGLLLAFTIHEFAHAWTGWRLGDDTPRRMGRLTLDPLAHLDPLGLVFVLLSFWYGFVVGWAKPVPINPRNFANPRRDSVLVAIAGPISNLLQVPFWLILLYGFGLVAKARGHQYLQFDGTDPESLICRIMIEGVVTNFLLAAFNMIPIPPLDGHWVLEGLGGPPVTEIYNVIRPYSMMVLLLVINFTPLDRILLGPVNAYAYTLSWHVLNVGAGVGP